MWIHLELLIEGCIRKKTREIASPAKSTTKRHLLPSNSNRFVLISFEKGPRPAFVAPSDNRDHGDKNVSVVEPCVLKLFVDFLHAAKAQARTSLQISSANDFGMDYPALRGVASTALHRSCRSTIDRPKVVRQKKDHVNIQLSLLLTPLST